MTRGGDARGAVLRQEIREQPRVLQRFAAEEVPRVEAIAQALRQADITHVVIAARGTSDNAATYGRYLIESFLGWPVSLAAPSLYTLYRRPPRLAHALVVGISQSGEAADVTEVVAEARRQGAATLAITNVPASPLAQAAQHVICCRAGPERSIAATKTYTSQLYALGWLVAALQDDAALRDALLALPDQMAETVEAAEACAPQVDAYAGVERCAVIGRGYNYATAFEVALKLKELTYITAEPYSSADFRHGPIAMVDEGFPVLLIAPTGVVLPDLQDLALDLRGRRARLVVLSDDAATLALGDLRLPLPPGVPEWLSPTLAVVPGQVFAACLALAKGLDPDRPRGLRKVTVTR
jgi:glucosamine--fructose-6-phosphate aminotransferase (isomerizing)